MEMNKALKAMPMVVCGMVLSANAQAVEILIDDYSTNQASITSNTVGVGASSQVNGGGILGDYRDIYVVETDNGSGGTDANAGVTSYVSGGRFNADLGNFVKGYVVITYDGANEVGNNWDTNVDTGGLGGIDFSFVQNFLFEGVYNDVVSPAQLNIWTNDGGLGTYVKHTLDFTTQAASDPTDPLGSLYDSYLAVTGFSDYANINWADVGAFQAAFNIDNSLSDSVASADLSVAEATAVPEPAALSMLGAGLLMLGFAGYRRKEQE